MPPGRRLPSGKVLTLYIDALRTTIRPVDARYCESHRSATFLDVVDFVQQEEDAVRARTTTPQ